MTSNTLGYKPLAESNPSNLIEVVRDTAAGSISANPPTQQTPQSSSSQPKQLPYQANHQVELLHLQAETEALLQQIQTAKQQRLASVH